MHHSPLSIGFIGGGLGSAVGLTHKIASQMDGRWRLVAGCFNPTSDANHQTAAAWGVSPDRTYDSWQLLLGRERGRLDAVVILTPTPSHLEMVLEALNAGFAVICEKALTASVEAADRIAEALRQTKGFLAVTYNYSGYPMVRELRQLCLSGRLGRVRQLHLEMPQEGFLKRGADGAPPHPQAWRQRDGAIPTVHLDLGVHLHQLVGFLTGASLEEVVATHDSQGLVEGVVDTVSALARGSDGLQCQLWFGKVALGHRNGLRIRVYGSEGAAEWLQLEPEYLWLSDNQGRSRRLTRGDADLMVADDPRYGRFKPGHPEGFLEAFANHYADIADAVIARREGRKEASPHVFGVETARDGLAFLDATAASSRCGQWQKVRAASAGRNETRGLLPELHIPVETLATIRDFMAHPQRRYLFGANDYAAAILDRLDVVAVVDDGRTERVFRGRPVITRAELPSDAIVISCLVGRPITGARALEACGARWSDFFAFSYHSGVALPPVRFWDNPRRELLENLDAYHWLMDHMSDEESRRVLSRLLGLRVSGNLACLEGFTDRQTVQYFEPFLRLKPEGESFLDIGGFDGWTSRCFMDRCPGFNRIEYFEPDAANMQRSKARLGDDARIRYHGVGLSDRRQQLRFEGEGSTFKLSPDGSRSIDVVPLDELVDGKPTFLKMDIEGGEAEALRGAQALIRRHHPRLAIAVYHRPGDFHEIPRQVLAIRSDYDLYLRHYTEGVVETVLFFMPRPS